MAWMPSLVSGTSLFLVRSGEAFSKVHTPYGISCSVRRMEMWEVATNRDSE